MSLKNFMSYEDASTVLGEYADAVNSLKSGLTNLSEEVNGDATTYPYADVITIDDAVPSNLADCSVKIEPVQDLHGYDKPWVGGAGKNKLPLTVDIAKSLNGGGTWTGNTYNFRDVDFTINTDSDGNVTSVKVNGTASQNVTLLLNFVGTASTEYYIGGCPAGGGNTYYFDTFSDGVARTADYGSGATFTADGNSQYVRIGVQQGYNAQNLMFYPMVCLNSETDKSFAPYSNICPISGHTEAVVTVADDDTDPTVTNTYTLALGDTIYGGTVDFDSGVMTVDRAIVEFDGSEDEVWQDQYGLKLKSISNALYSAGTITCFSNEFKTFIDTVAWADLLASDNIATITKDGNLIKLGVVYKATADLTEFKAFLANSPLQICYKLATPFTIQLTTQQIQLLQGTNTLYASTGDISVTVNGVSGAIGQVQTQANATDAALAQLAADVAEQLPTAPTTDGAYVLTVTVADGAATYSWESAT